MNVAIIPARAGSTRIPGKNIKPFMGRPIIAYSIETARKSCLFEEIWVSTDSDEIGKIAEREGARVHVRPMRLAVNEVGTQEVAKAVLQDIKAGRFEFACVVYATAPMMREADMTRALRCLQETPDAPFAYSVGAMPVRDAGQFYFGRTRAFIQDEPLDGPDVLKVVVPQDRVCDINTMEDWNKAESMFCRIHGIRKTT